MFCFWHENRHIDQQSRIAKPERNTHIYCWLAYEKGAKNIQWGKDKLYKMTLGKLDSPMKKQNCAHLLTYTKSTKKGLKI